MKYILSFISFIIAISCRSENILPEPKVKLVTATLSGMLTNKERHKKSDKISLALTVYYPITANSVTFDIDLKDDNRFKIEVPLETSYAISYLNVGEESGNLIVGLVGGKETTLKIIYGDTGTKQVDICGNFPLKPYDVTNSAIVMNDMVEGNHPYRKRASKDTLYKKSKDYYISYSMKLLKDKEEIADNDSCLSLEAKEILKNEIKLFLINNQFLNYRNMVRINYINLNSEKNKNDYVDPSDPDKSYYQFLKQMNLNDPNLLYSSYEYSKLCETILENDTLGIPIISETPIDDWLQKTKLLLVDVLGFKTGLFYDVLVANAYARQLNMQVIPLSDKQIENIKLYYKGSDVEKILLQKNQEIIKLAKEKDEMIISSIPTVTKELLVDAIIKKYNGKTVVVDFWATWCGPCLQAMKESRELRNELKSEGVVFIYLTNRSSPQKLWKELIHGIGGEHYYLDDEQWEYVMNYFGFQYIPSYAIFKEGKLKSKMSGFPGVEKMRKQIGL